MAADSAATIAMPITESRQMVAAARRLAAAKTSSTFVVRLYYASDADVIGDPELASFVREVGAEGGRLPAMVAGFAPRTVGDVVDLVSRVLYRATAYRATINNSNYDLANMLPSSAIGWETITATYQVANLHINWLGKYDVSKRARLDRGRDERAERVAPDALHVSSSIADHGQHQRLNAVGGVGAVPPSSASERATRRRSRALRARRLHGRSPRMRRTRRA